MHVAVLGLGDFGFNLASWLTTLGNEVLAVDRSPELVQKIMDKVSKAVVADVTDRESLAELGIGEMDCALISVGRRLETNVLLTHHLAAIGVPRILVRVADEEQAKILKLVGATDVVQPDRDIAARVAAMITFPRLVEYIALEGPYRVVAVKAPAKYLGKTLDELGLTRQDDIRVLAVDPAGPDTPPFTPSADHLVHESDTLVFMGEVGRLLRELR
jgi:trk system potassium uptake protein TrkA